ncbi:DUF4349 domain-containing protein [Chloroflexota bacterium]
MKRLLPYSFLVIAAIILGACGGNAASTPEFDSQSPALAPMPTMGVVMQEAARDNSAGGGESAQVQRLVIQNADLTIVVSDVELRMKAIEKMAQDMGGFVVSSNLYQSYTSDYTPVPEATISVRVPAENLDEALELIKKDAVEVQSENRSGTDVTAEYVDLKSRLKNLEAAEKQLTGILESATETEDVVNVFNQLVYYREQIEVVKGQIKYYEEAAALSSVSIRLIAEATIKPVTIGKWEPKGVALEAIQNLLDFWKGFVEFMIGFIIFTLPMLVTIAIPLYLGFIAIRWIFRKLRGDKKKVAEPKKEEEKSK